MNATQKSVEHSLSLMLQYSDQIEAFFSVDLQRDRGVLTPTVTIINTAEVSEEQEKKLKGALWTIAAVYRELYAEKVSRPEAADSVIDGSKSSPASE